MRAAFSTNIQIARAVAAVAVVLVHAGPQLDVVAGRPRTRTFPGLPLDLNMGVDLFFVVSGFVMLQVTWDRFGERSWVRTFVVQRAIRIVPLYWLSTSLVLAVTLVLPNLVDQQDPDPFWVIASYLFIPWPDGNGDLLPILVPGWTLSVEVFFYALVAAVLVFRRRIALVVLIGLLATVVVLGKLPNAPAWLHLGWGNPIVLEFCLGLGIGWLQRWGLRIAAVPAVVLVVAGLGGAVAWVAWGPTEAPRLLSLGVPAALMIAAAALGPQAPARGLPRVAMSLGDGSYAVYLTHTVTLKAMAFVLAAVSAPRPVGICAVVVGTVAVGLAVDRLVDRPMRRRLMAARDQRPGRRAAQAQAQAQA